MKDEEGADTTRGWGTIASLLSDAAEIALEKDRDDIFNMISDSFDEIEKIKEPEELLMTAFQFAFRIYYRMKRFSGDMPLNRVVKTTLIEPRIGAIDAYMLSNYDFKMFTWARRRGFGSRIDNLTISFPASELTPAERARFDKKIQNS